MIVLQNNHKSIQLSDITPLDYSYFYELVCSLMNSEVRHCVNYFALPQKDGILCICLIAEENENVRLLAHKIKKQKQKSLLSLTERIPAFHCYEREMYENFGINFINHPFLKPLRFPHNAANKDLNVTNYPFYSIAGDEVHEVGVGPIHAGIIEPGYFRFCCNGEKVIHLEPVLGYQHRGVESLMVKKEHLLQQSIIAEDVAGDTTIGHALAYVMAVESLAGVNVSPRLLLERIVALEMERVAMHIADTAALFMDVGYQLGQVVCEALRTIVINTMQKWCGNRFGKGLIRPTGSYYPIYQQLASDIITALTNVNNRYKNITDRAFTLPSLLARIETVGTLSYKQALSLGMVGLVARASGVKRDIRTTHAYQSLKHCTYANPILSNGDIASRLKLRVIEVEQSIDLIVEFLEEMTAIPSQLPESKPNYDLPLQADSLALSLVEGWRGEICHVAITDENGKLAQYKIKDPSLHNWYGLAVTMREQQISDFPICNKSFNLSYCGHDL